MTIKQQFEQMKAQPIFEINLQGYLDLDDAEYYIFDLNATETHFEAGAITNAGFYSLGIEEEFDEDLTVDEHLFLLFDKCVEWAINDFEDNLEQQLKEERRSYEND